MNTLEWRVSGTTSEKHCKDESQSSKEGLRQSWLVKSNNDFKYPVFGHRLLGKAPANPRDPEKEQVSIEDE